MNFVKLIEESNRSPHAKSVTAAFLGDSITQGVFELVRSKDRDKVFDCVYDYESVYHSLFKKKLNVLYPCARINIINAGNNGTDAACGYERLKRDVLDYSPDLVVVCFGTNDCIAGEEGLDAYAENLQKIFKELKKENIETIFLTPNFMAERIAPEIYDIPGLLESAEVIVKAQLDGISDLYFDRAKEVCKQNDVVVCDCRAKWHEMKANGIDTTALLCNHLNHPSRELHHLFADMLIESVMSK